MVFGLMQLAVQCTYGMAGFAVKFDAVGELLHRTQIERDFVVLPGRNGGVANSIEMLQSHFFHSFISAFSQSQLRVGCYIRC